MLYCGGLLVLSEGERVKGLKGADITTGIINTNEYSNSIVEPLHPFDISEACKKSTEC